MLVRSQMWIRLLNIPQPWIEEGELTGGRIYRQVFEKVLEFGCVALGLYRGGDARVRLGLGSDHAHMPAYYAQAVLDQKLSSLHSHESDPLLNWRRGQYVCPTTGRVTAYEEQLVAGNTLPYVLTAPEPFCHVMDTDGVYVLCHPATEVPHEWASQQAH